MKKTFILPIIFFSMVSCVSNKQFKASQDDLSACKQENAEKEKNLNKAQIKIDNLQNDKEALEKRLSEIIADTVRQSKEAHQNKIALQSLRSQYDMLAKQMDSKHNENEIKGLLADLQKSQDKLQAREDALSKAEKDLKLSTEKLSEKEKKVEMLTRKISQQDSLMKALRQSVSSALKGYVGNGLEVENKNGKVYVSLDEKLLFNSGSWEVDEKGEVALRKISKLLAENKDIHVVIEGHTDDLAYRGNGYILDNWDLSVKRSTSIIRILLKEEGIDPARITASGRAEFVPIDNAKTKEARQKNRRTEIILSPNMDELMQTISE